MAGRGVPLLQYADDTFFFIEGSREAAERTSALLEMFSDFSGLSLNKTKSTFIAFGMSSEETSQCASILSTPVGSLPIQYLGLPLVGERLSSQEWQPVVVTMERRLGGWRAWLLSRGRRLVLLKAVLSALPTYYMSLFRVPVGVHKRMEAMMRRDREVVDFTRSRVKNYSELTNLGN